MLYALTGGRPMERMELAFKDVNTGKEVFYHRDQFGRLLDGQRPVVPVKDQSDDRDPSRSSRLKSFLSVIQTPSTLRQSAPRPLSTERA